MRERRQIVAAVSGLLALVAGADARAQVTCPTPGTPEEARALAGENFNAAREAYEAERPLRALQYYQCSYQLVPHPDTLYNIAVLADSLGELDTARSAYQEYLDRFPDAGDRADVQTRLAALEARQAASQPQVPEPTPSPAPGPQPEPEAPLPGPSPFELQPQPQTLTPPTPAPEPTVTQPQPEQPPAPAPAPAQHPRRTAGRVAAIATMPAGLVVVVIGAGLVAGASSTNDDFLYRREQYEGGSSFYSWTSLSELADYGRNLQIAGWVMVGLGTAIVAGSIVLFALIPRYRQAPAAASIAPLVLGDGGGLALSGRF